MIIRCWPTIWFLVILYLGGAFSSCKEQKVTFEDLHPEVVSQRATPSSNGTQLVLLGTGTPIPERNSLGPASAIIANNRSYLIDAGVGIVRQAQAAYERGIDSLQPTKLHTVFLTHLHSDHTMGLPDLIFTPWIIGNDKGLDIYGPPGTKKMVTYLLLAWEDDVSIRQQGKSPTESITSKIRVHEIQPGTFFKNNSIEVTAFPVKHGDWEHAYGYQFVTDDKKIVISGDTSPTDTVSNACNGCDILLHEVFSAKGFKIGPPAWKNYHSRYHTSTVALAKLAAVAKPKQLILYHKLFFGQTEEGLVKEITDIYAGQVHLGHDLDVYK